MIKYVIHAKKWFDKVNGNTYHSVRVLDTVRQLQLKVPFQYGYGDHYRTTPSFLKILTPYTPKNLPLFYIYASIILN